MYHETIPYWQEKLGIEFGMARKEALEKFFDWQEDKKTCQRCEGEEYFNLCPVRFICAAVLGEEVIEDESGEVDRGEIDPGAGLVENLGLEEVGIG